MRRPAAADRLRAPVTGDPRELYAHLALAQHGAHNAYLDLVIASASPELFSSGTATTCRPAR